MSLIYYVGATYLISTLPYPMDIFTKQVADKKSTQPQQSQNSSKNNGNKSDQPQSAKKSTHLESSQKHKNKKPHFKPNKQQEQK